MILHPSVTVSALFAMTLLPTHAAQCAGESSPDCTTDIITQFIPSPDENRMLGSGAYAGLKPTPNDMHVRYFGPFLPDLKVGYELLDDYDKRAAERSEKGCAPFDWYEITVRKECFPYYLKDEPNLLVRVGEDGKTLDDAVIGIVSGLGGKLEHIDNANGRFTAKIAPDMLEKLRANPVIQKVETLHLGVARTQIRPVPLEASQLKQADELFLKQWKASNELTREKCAGIGLKHLPGKPCESTVFVLPESSVMEEAAADIVRANDEAARECTTATFLPDWYLLVPREGAFPAYFQTPDGMLFRASADGKTLGELARAVVDSAGGRLSMVYPVSSGFTAKIPEEKVDEVRHNPAIRYVVRCPMQVLEAEIHYSAIQRAANDAKREPGDNAPLK
jgi:hypothetical protein